MTETIGQSEPPKSEWQKRLANQSRRNLSDGNDWAIKITEIWMTETISQSKSSKSEWQERLGNQSRRNLSDRHDQPVHVPGAARDFSPSANFQCRLLLCPYGPSSNGSPERTHWQRSSTTTDHRSHWGDITYIKPCRRKGSFSRSRSFFRSSRRKMEREKRCSLDVCVRVWVCICSFVGGCSGSGGFCLDIVIVTLTRYFCILY